MEDKQIQNTDRVEEQTQETSIKQQLTKSFFGMYNEKSINKYVASIQQNSRQIQEGLEKQIQELLADKANITQEAALLRNQLIKTEAEYSRDNVQLKEQLRIRTERLELLEREQAELRSEQLNAKADDSLANRLQSEIDAKQVELDSQNRACEDLRTQLTEMQYRMQELEAEKNRLLSNEESLSSEKYDALLLKYNELLENKQARDQEIAKTEEDRYRRLANTKEGLAAELDEVYKLLKLLLGNDNTIFSSRHETEANLHALWTEERVSKEDLERRLVEKAAQLEARQTEINSLQAKLDGRDLLVQKHSETAARLEKENAKYAAQAEACNELIRSLLLEFKRQIGLLTAISQLYNQSESSMLRIMKDNVEAHGRRLNLFDEENAQEAAAEQESHEAGDDAASASIKATDNKTEEWHPQAETRTEPHQSSMTEAIRAIKTEIFPEDIKPRLDQFLSSMDDVDEQASIQYDSDEF